jgi:hypothetical protein
MASKLEILRNEDPLNLYASFANTEYLLQIDSDNLTCKLISNNHAYLAASATKVLWEGYISDFIVCNTSASINDPIQTGDTAVFIDVNHKTWNFKALNSYNLINEANLSYLPNPIPVNHPDIRLCYYTPSVERCLKIYKVNLVLRLVVKFTPFLTKVPLLTGGDVIKAKILHVNPSEAQIIAQIVSAKPKSPDWQNKPLIFDLRNTTMLTSEHAPGTVLVRIPSKPKDLQIDLEALAAPFKQAILQDYELNQLIAHRTISAHNLN